MPKKVTDMITSDEAFQLVEDLDTHMQTIIGLTHDWWEHRVTSVEEPRVFMFSTAKVTVSFKDSQVTMEVGGNLYAGMLLISMLAKASADADSNVEVDREKYNDTRFSGAFWIFPTTVKFSKELEAAYASEQELILNKSKLQ